MVSVLPFDTQVHETVLCVRYKQTLRSDVADAGVRAIYGFRLQLRTWIFVSVTCCVGSGLCDGLIIRREEF
jgi:hypothetical protein